MPVILFAVYFPSFYKQESSREFDKSNDPSSALRAIKVSVFLNKALIKKNVCYVTSLLSCLSVVSRPN